MIRECYVADRKENDVRRLHGVLGRHDDPPVVDPTLLMSLLTNPREAEERSHLEFRVLWTPDSEVPLEEVLLQRGRRVVAGGLRHLQRLSHQSLDS